jgi:hypothetical protein
MGVPPKNLDLSEELLAIREQLAALQEQLSALAERHQRLCGMLTPQQPAAATAPVQVVLADCAQDIVRVLREVGRPLNTLEILDEMVHRELRWRESVVSHTLAELMDHGLVENIGDGGLHRYRLKGSQ